MRVVLGEVDVGGQSGHPYEAEDVIASGQEEVDQRLDPDVIPLHR